MRSKLDFFGVWEGNAAFGGCTIEDGEGEILCYWSFFPFFSFLFLVDNLSVGCVGVWRTWACMVW